MNPESTIYRAHDLIHSMMGTCALRFDGYGYEERTGKELHKLADRVITRQKPLRNRLDNFAAFFAIQRGIGHCGYDLVTNTRCRAFILLFLHLAEQPTPDEWRFEQFAPKWERQFAPRVEMHVAAVREIAGEIAAFDAALAAAGCKLTPETSLLVPGEPGWPVPGCLYWHGVPFGQPPSICEKPSLKDPDLHTERRPLTAEEMHAICTDAALAPVRLYFEFHGCFDKE